MTFVDFNMGIPILTDLYRVNLEFNGLFYQ